MKNPKEKLNQEQKKSANKESADKPSKKSKENKETNWDKHQQIDEEGNQVSPEDIK